MTAIICKRCNTEHGDKVRRNEDCPVLAAEKRIAHLYHNGGSADELREAIAQRTAALGNWAKVR